MTTPAPVSAAFFASLAALGPTGQDGAPSADAVLAKLEAAIGDAGARARAANVVMSGKVTFENMPGEGSVEEIYLASGAAKCSTAWPSWAAMTQGATDAYCWSTDPALGITIKEGAEAGSVRRQFAIARRAPWRALYASARLAGESEVGGRPCWELEMLPEGGKPERWFVERETGALLRVDLALPNPTGGELPVEYHFADFRAVDGVSYPHVRKMRVGDMVLVTTFARIAHEKELAPERVAPPADVVAAFADPKKRTQALPDAPGECSLTTLEAQPAATIRVKVPADQVSQNLALILPEVGAYLVETGVDMVGPPFTRYHALGETIDLEAGMATKTRVAGRGRIQATELPAGRTAIAWHFGAYHDLPKTYARLEAWMKSESLAARAPFWEIYWTDPGIEPDPARWRTQVLWPVE